MSEHTKGEWFNNGAHVGVITSGNGCLHVASAMSTENGCWQSPEEAEANAKLIAAAPDLLNLAELIVDYCEQHRRACIPISYALQLIENKAGKAIAKAKGESK